MTHNIADRFAIVPVSHGPAPDEAIVVGPLSEVFEYIPQSIARNDANEQLERARFTADQISAMQEKTRAVQASMLADSVAHLSARLDTFLQRRADEERERVAAEAAAEAKRIQDELAALPDPDNPDTHEPGGEMHALQAKAEHDQAEFVLPEPEDPTGTVIPQPTAVEFDGD